MGVVVVDGDRIEARFEGEDEHARLDRWRIRKRVTGRDAYTAWVAHWRRLIERRDEEAVLAASSPDFYLEPGGRVMFDLDERPIDDSVRDLYARLVKPEDPPAPVSLTEKSLRSRRLAGADLDDDTRFRKDVKVAIASEDSLSRSVSYGIKNGH